MSCTASIQATQSKVFCYHHSHLSLKPQMCAFAVNLLHSSAVVAHNTASKVNYGHEASASVMGSKASSAWILPSLKNCVVTVTWEGTTLMDITSSTSSKLPVPPFDVSKKLSHMWANITGFTSLASQIAYTMQVMTRSHVLFSLTSDLWVHQEKEVLFEERPSPDFERLMIAGSPGQLS